MSPFSFRQTHQAASPPNASRGISPVMQRQQQPGSSSRAASRTPPPPQSTKYNPALYTAGSGSSPHLRGSNVSPMGLRLHHHQGDDGGVGGQYDPSAYGRIAAGNGGEFVPRHRQDEEAHLPPPPYSPGHSNRNPQHQLHVSPPLRQLSSWSQNNPLPRSPNNSQQTPSTATTQNSFSPLYSPASGSSATTPQTPHDRSAATSPNRQRIGYTSPTISSYNPSTSQQTTYAPNTRSPLSKSPPIPSNNRNQPTILPHHRLPVGISSNAVPPPPPLPPGPPPLTSPNVVLPPPPPGPPPRTDISPRPEHLTQQHRSLSTSVQVPMQGPDTQPAGGGYESRSKPQQQQKNYRQQTPPSVPALPPLIPPKRKILEPHQDSGRQRESPRQEQQRQREKEQRRLELEAENNNPWRDALDVTASSPSVNPAIRRKPVVDNSKATSQMVYSDHGVNRGGLPTPPPISPGEGPSGVRKTKPDNGKQAVDDNFVQLAKRRYKEMLRAEAAAPLESEKVHVFLEFMERECRFRALVYTRADAKYLDKLKAVTRAIENGCGNQQGRNNDSMAPVSLENGGEDVDMASPPFNRAELVQQSTPRPSSQSQWWGTPALTSSAFERRTHEEESSRGRTSSRWWETSVEGGSCSENIRSDGGHSDFNSVYGSAFPRRNRRKAKHQKQSLREIAEIVTHSPRNSVNTNPNDPRSYQNSSAFPPDYKEPMSEGRSRSRPSSSRPRPAPRIVKTSLDIAPLLTLLPAWPKEFPAINNCHPRLDVFRDLVRTLNDTSALTALHTNFTAKLSSQKSAFAADSQRRRVSQAERIQGLYARGDLHHSEMERLNIDFEREEDKIAREAAEEEFKAYDNEVVTPAHRDLHERITAATAAYSDLVALISTPYVQSSPNEPEEGPELLEHLTALKWIFDVRETLHRQVHDLLTERSNRYQSLVLNNDPAHESFFISGARSRQVSYLSARVARHNDFLDLVEHHVTQGVEGARSRFWEIAPLVMECCEKIPIDLSGVVPIVPPEESVEHPEWSRQPIRYLERKLSEAEGAMRSLGVEEGESLLCLLHGVKSGITRARAEAEEAGASDGRGTGGFGESWIKSEEERLLSDLKDKVGMIEEEWREGLGAVLNGVRGRVEEVVERGEIMEPGVRASGLGLSMLVG